MSSPLARSGEMLREMAERLEAQAGHVDMSFPYFVNKEGPGIWRREPDGLSGQPRRGTFATATHASRSGLRCPLPACVHARSKYLTTAPTTSAPTVTVTARTKGFVWIEELIDLVEDEASCEPLRRIEAPRREVRDRARVRQPRSSSKTWSATLPADSMRTTALPRTMVESENFESIHNHSAYAMVEHDKELDNAQDSPAAPLQTPKA